MPEISKTADQALAALAELCESGPMTAAQLSRSMGLNRTIVHRLLTTLHRRGFITRHNGSYQPGALLVRMASRVQPELRAAAAEAMAALAEEAGETVVMHIADGNDAVVLDQVVGVRHVVRVEHRIGSRHPLTTGASGRALLAFMEDGAAARVIQGADDPVGLKQQLASVRELGYSLSHDELQQGVWGVAVPVRGQTGAVLSSLAVLIPATRAPSIAEHLPALRSSAMRIGDSLYRLDDLADPPV
ncbi:MAG TPA: IclR family transcriptional regulator C-terminal domain-containing protein [Solirubrobacteraceae bacterium]|nr:IclR family transcriptional regulator C-terminal domain-containing protein [Solirubrobacteraceae bacterium]